MRQTRFFHALFEANAPATVQMAAAGGKFLQVRTITFGFENTDAIPQSCVVAIYSGTLAVPSYAYQIVVGPVPAGGVAFVCLNIGQDLSVLGTLAVGATAPLPDMFFDQNIVVTITPDGATWQLSNLGVVCNAA